MTRHWQLVVLCSALLASTARLSLAESDLPVLKGDLSRDEIESAVPSWVEAEVLASPDAQAARDLELALRGAEVTIYLGTWCGDSRREMGRLWRAMDEGGLVDPPQVRYIGVDRRKRKPKAMLKGVGLLYVPTIVVRRDGLEVGRIVETSPLGVERDLLSLLTGENEGLITTRTDLLDRRRGEDGR